MPALVPAVTTNHTQVTANPKQSQGNDPINARASCSLKPTLRCTLWNCIWPGRACSRTSLRASLGIHMHTTILTKFFEISHIAVAMCSAGILLFLVALWAARSDILRARGLD